MKIASEKDKEILRRVMSDPTFKKADEAMKRENAKLEQSVFDMLSSAGSQALKGDGEEDLQ